MTYRVSVAMNVKFPLKPNVRWHKVEPVADPLFGVCGVRLVLQTRFAPIVCDDTFGTRAFEARRNDCPKCWR